MSPHLSDELLLRRIDDELAGGELAAAGRHLAVCDDCRAHLRRLERVSAALDAHAVALSGPGQPPRDRLIGALGTQRRASWDRIAAAAAACILAAAALWSPIWKRPAVPVQQLAGGFIALPYSDSNLAEEDGVILRVEVPREALVLAGALASDHTTCDRVPAEVLVGADGMARAIRFLN